MPRTTFLIVVLAGAAVVAGAVDAANGVDRPVQRLVEGAVLTVIVLGVWVLAAREQVIASLATPGPVQPRDRALGLAALAVAVVAALLSDGLGLSMAVFLAALALLVAIATRSRARPRL